MSIISHAQTPCEDEPMTSTTNGKILWLLDNGHGIDTPGKRSPRLTDGRQLLEYRFNREVVSTMYELLERKEFRSLQLVPEEEDVTLDYYYLI